MTRPVEGFLTKDGTFFAQEHEAQTYEAIADFNADLRTYLEKKGLGGMLLDYTMDNVRYFVSHHKSTVSAYVEHVGMDAVPEPPDHDIRLTPPEPTGPVVAKSTGRELYRGDDPYEPYPVVDDIPDDPVSSEEGLDAALESDFVSGFDQTLGGDDSGGTEAGGDEVDRQPQSGEPDVHQRVRSSGISVVAE